MAQGSSQNRKILITSLYILSFSFSLSYLSIASYVPDLPLLKDKEKYTIELNPENAEVKDTSNENFYKKWGELVYRDYGIVALSFILLFFYFNKKIDKQLLFFITSGIVLYTFSNIVEFSPPLSGRVKTVSAVYILAAAVYLLLTLNKYRLSKLHKALFNTGLWLFLLSSVPVALFHISYIMNMLSVFIFALPLISWILGDADFTIREALGFLM